MCVYIYIFTHIRHVYMYIYIYICHVCIYIYAPGPATLPPPYVRHLEAISQAQRLWINTNQKAAKQTIGAGDKSYMQYCQYKERCRLQLHVSRHLNPFHPAYMHKKWCRKIDANRQWHPPPPPMGWVPYTAPI